MNSKIKKEGGTLDEVIHKKIVVITDLKTYLRALELKNKAKCKSWDEFFKLLLDHYERSKET